MGKINTCRVNTLDYVDTQKLYFWMFQPEAQLRTVSSSIDFVIDDLNHLAEKHMRGFSRDDDGQLVKRSLEP